MILRFHLRGTASPYAEDLKAITLVACDALKASCQEELAAVIEVEIQKPDSIDNSP